MIKPIQRMLVLMAVLVSGTVPAATAAADPAAVEIVSAEFGTFDTGTPDEMLFEATRAVPHRQGQRYGWVIELRSRQRSLSVREEYLLPAAAPSVKPRRATDSPGELLEIPQQRRNQVSQRQLVPVDGKIIGEWSVGPNEPAGHRHLQVIIEGQLAADFEFDVK